MSTSEITAYTLYRNYKSHFQSISKHIRKTQVKAIPYITLIITTQVVPSMAQDLGKIKGLSGEQKKTLILNAIDYAIKRVFHNLNKLPELSTETWDEDLRDMLLPLIGATLNNLISVEQGKLKFNKTSSLCSCFK